MDPSEINLALYSIHNQCASECKFSFLRPALCPGLKPSQANECQVSSSSEHDMETLECGNDSDNSDHYHQTVSALANYHIDNNGRLVLEPFNCVFGGPKFLCKLLPVKELNADFLFEQTNVLLENLKEAGANVCAIVCDGNRVNQAFYKNLIPLILGAQKTICSSCSIMSTFSKT